MTELTVKVSAPPTGDIPCRGQQYLFYGRHAERPQTRVRREIKAKEVCRTCPQTKTCRDYARSNNEVFGVWGGETEIERYNAGFLEFVPHHLSRNGAIVKRNEHL
jgi:WhiB family redox-sensing transcriptional regulator